ncbi:NADPH:quinone reductase [Rhodococcus sp. WMMA185]|uniref:quinone oxidoreductase family protein n=1 Tax=Rhodococcus sp. WMMA185 TaxID=679318 RepID=UPI00087842CE|nr:quinone oxidoreductase [Rhodococcus sp. WMMA185]AOW92595.1 NADPH:quinone reductase [Rhodococcus sp. WMMA185]
MRAIQVSRTGGPEVLESVEIPEPAIGASDLLVRTDAIGINYIDTYFRSGLYPRPLPYVAGEEGSGVVEAVGSEVTDFAPGDRVAWCFAPGSYAEKVSVPASAAIVVPDPVPAAVAASVLLQGMTAHFLVHTTYPIQAGDTVLVHAGAGGVGLILTQLATKLGARVITTVSSDAKEKLSREAGAFEVLRYDDFATRVRELTDGEGAAAVYDGVGAATFDQSLESVRVRGTLALFGAASGPVPPFDPQRLNSAGSVMLTRPTLTHFIRDREEFNWRAGDVLSALADGTLKIRIGGEYSLDRAADAHRDLEGRKTTGSIVLVP